MAELRDNAEGSEECTRRHLHGERFASPAVETTKSASANSALPSWMTPELIESTQRVWQPYYEKPLTTDDAVEILRNVSQLMRALAPSR